MGLRTTHDAMLSWSFLAFAPIMGLCVVLILANVITSTLQKHPIHWKLLRRLSSVATMAAGLITTITIVVLLEASLQVGLMLLLPIGLLRWTLASWVRHEANPDAGGETFDTPRIFSRDHFLAFLMIVTPILIFTGTWGYCFYVLTTPRFDTVNCFHLYLALLMIGVALCINGRTYSKQLDKLFAGSSLMLLMYLSIQFVAMFSIIGLSVQPPLMEMVHAGILLGVVGLVMVGFFRNALWTKWAVLGYVGVVLLQNTVLLGQTHPWIAERHIDWIGLKLAFLNQITYKLPESVIQKLQVSGNESVTRQVATSSTIATPIWFYYWFGVLALVYVFGMRKQKRQDTTTTDAASLAFSNDDAKQGA